MEYPGQSVFTTATRPKALGRRAECRRTVNQFFRLVEPSQLAFEDAEVIQCIRVVGVFVQKPQTEGLGVFETARFVVIEGTRKKIRFGHSLPLRPAQVFQRVEDAVAAACARGLFECLTPSDQVFDAPIPASPRPPR